jgi:hypothetical protein
VAVEVEKVATVRVMASVLPLTSAAAADRTAEFK